MKNISVSSLSIGSVVKVDVHQTVKEAAQLMNRHGVGCVVVTNEAGIPQGILTDRDIVVRCVATEMAMKDVKVGAVMTTPVKSISEEAQIHDASELMRQSAIRRIVVVDKAGILKGLLCVDDIIFAFGRSFGAFSDLLLAQCGTEKRHTTHDFTKMA